MHAVTHRVGKPNRTAHGPKVLVERAVVAVEAPLHEAREAELQDLREEILRVLEGFTLHPLSSTMPQRPIGVGEHVVDVPDDDAV